MKNPLRILIAILLCSVLLLSACGNGDNGDNGEDASDDGSISLGQTFEFDGLEITFSSNIGYSRVRDRFSDIHNELIFSIPTTVTNVGEGGNALHSWLFTVFAPNGMSTSVLDSWLYEDTNILSIGAVQPGTKIEGNLYVMYNEDGEYLIEFDNVEERVEVRFALTFNHAAVPEIKTEFVLGETLTVEGVEITIADIVSWGTVLNSWSDLQGEHYFYLPVTLRNVSDESKSFPWDFDIFGPAGNALANVVWDIDEEDITRSGDVLPGASTMGNLHVLYVGDGDYVLQFKDWEFGDELRVTVPIVLDQDALPVIQTEFTLGETFVFDDLEITFHDDFEWAQVVARWHDLAGESVFILPVSVTNVGEESNSFPWNVTRFGPSGLELENVAFIADDDITRSGDIRPGATLEGQINILYDGDGEYVIELSTWQNTIQVIFNVTQ